MGNKDVFSTPRRGGVWVWVLCVLLTAASLVYQRMTGPTYPIPVSESWEGGKLKGKLIRTQVRPDRARIELSAVDLPEAMAELVWRRYPTQDAWTEVPMRRDGDRFSAELPLMPSAGKAEYVVRLESGSAKKALPEDGSAILRYRDDVPAFVLIPHVIAMFGGFLVGLRLIMAALRNEDGLARFFPWLMAFIVPGGLILGPLVQKYAFDAYWTGWPVGEDLTDTKTLVAVVAWLLAWWALPSLGRSGRWAVLAAGLVMLAVYMIPHSVRGSQVDWSKQPAAQASQTP